MWRLSLALLVLRMALPVLCSLVYPGTALVPEITRQFQNKNVQNGPEARGTAARRVARTSEKRNIRPCHRAANPGRARPLSCATASTKYTAVDRHEAIEHHGACRHAKIRAVTSTVRSKNFSSAKADGNTILRVPLQGAYCYYYGIWNAMPTGCVNEGMRVSGGQLIGYVKRWTGDTSPAAPYLHFAIYVIGPRAGVGGRVLPSIPIRFSSFSLICVAIVFRARLPDSRDAARCRLKGFDLHEGSAAA